MQKMVINVGDKIEMTHVKSATRGKISESTYTSMLLDFESERVIKIAMPTHGGKLVPLEVNDEYELCFFASSGLYRSRARIIRRFREGKMYVLNVQMLFQPKKFQRRQFYRLECMQEIRYRIITNEEATLESFIKVTEFENDDVRKNYIKKLEELKTNWENAILTDISGGGVRLQSNNAVEEGQLIELAMPLVVDNETISFKCRAKVIANVKVDGSVNKRELRCQYDNISPEQQEFVVRYVFEEQKRRLRKE